MLREIVASTQYLDVRRVFRRTTLRVRNDVVEMKVPERKQNVEAELRRLTETAAQAGPSAFLVQAINDREQELRHIADKLLSTGPESLTHVWKKYGCSSVRCSQTLGCSCRGMKLPIQWRYERN